MKPLAALFVCALALPLQAQDSDRWWCDVDGPERISFGAAGIGLNEHGFCDTDTPVELTNDNNDTWSGAVTCANVYVIDADNDGTTEVIRQPNTEITHMTLIGAGDGTLVLRINNDEHRETYFLPCGS